MGVLEFYCLLFLKIKTVRIEILYFFAGLVTKLALHFDHDSYSEVDTKGSSDNESSRSTEMNKRL